MSSSDSVVAPLAAMSAESMTVTEAPVGSAGGPVTITGAPPGAAGVRGGAARRRRRGRPAAGRGRRVAAAEPARQGRAARCGADAWVRTWDAGDGAGGERSG